MISAFSGDAFLAARSFRAAVAKASAVGRDVRRLGEGVDAAAVREASSQGSLFGRSTVALDLDEGFLGAGASGTAGRNAVLDTLAEAGAHADLLVLDSAATPPRQKRYRALGELVHAPTPRFAQLDRWVRAELEAEGVEAAADVAPTLVDLFGEDLAAIASEVAKLRAFGVRVDGERVRGIANRPASRSAFDLVDAIVSGDGGAALQLARGLLDAGEAPVRIMAALGWQLDLVAGCLALEGLSADEAARALKANPYPTRKALAVARHLDEGALAALLETFVAADVRMKGGGDPEWQLEACVLALANALASARRAAPGGTARSVGPAR